MISWAIARDFVLFGDKIKLTLSRQLLSAEKSYCSYVERGQDNREYQGTAGVEWEREVWDSHFLGAGSDLQEIEKQSSRSYASMLSQNAAMSGWGRSGVEAVCGTYNVARKNG